MRLADEWRAGQGALSEGKEGEESPQAGSSDKVESRGGVVDCRVESLGGSV